MPELRQCRSCIHDYVASPGGRHDCARFRGAIKTREPALLWIREQTFGEDGLPRPDADGCPGYVSVLLAESRPARPDRMRLTGG